MVMVNFFYTLKRLEHDKATEVTRNRCLLQCVMKRVTCPGVTVIFINVRCFDEVILSVVAAVTLTSVAVNLWLLD